MVVPFALWTPVFLGLIVSSIELGTVTIRHTVLERSLDSTVRELKLGTGASDHAGIKASICSQSNVLPGCEDRLHIEMITLDMNNWAAPDMTADCVDTTSVTTPQRTFQHGGSHEMTLIRACYKFKPATPIGGLNASLSKDADGFSALVSTTAFVSEPR